MVTAGLRFPLISPLAASAGDRETILDVRAADLQEETAEQRFFRFVGLYRSQRRSSEHRCER